LNGFARPRPPTASLALSLGHEILECMKEKLRFTGDFSKNKLFICLICLVYYNGCGVWTDATRISSPTGFTTTIFVCILKRLFSRIYRAGSGIIHLSANTTGERHG
jgi:hypothetical protein